MASRIGSIDSPKEESQSRRGTANPSPPQSGVTKAVVNHRTAHARHQAIPTRRAVRFIPEGCRAGRAKSTALALGLLGTISRKCQRIVCVEDSRKRRNLLGSEIIGIRKIVPAPTG